MVKWLMPRVPGPGRFWITTAFLIGTWLLLNTTSRGEPIVPRKPLHDIPYSLGKWNGKEEPFDNKVMQVVGVTDYTNRIYSDGAGFPLAIYVGYYASQRTGDTIHSPKNCLPGEGWEPVRSGYSVIPLPNGNQIRVNEYVVQQDQQKDLVFYWYQGRGRVIASEYTGKFWMITDAISRNRTDGALVRLITSMSDSEVNAQSRLVAFTQLVFPSLDTLIPK